MLVVLDHLPDVLAINVIGAEYGNNIRAGLLDKIDVLVDGVGGSAIPVLARGPHLRGHRDDELVLENAAEIPTVAEVLEQGLAAELDHHVNGVDPGIDQIAENEIYNSILAAERNRGFGALLGERVEPRAFAAGKHDG